MRRALHALFLAVPLTAAAETVPPPVAAAIAKAKEICGSEPATLKPDFIERRDVNGDDVPDFILNLSAVQCGHDALSCGTGGCPMQVFASSKSGFVDAFDTFAYDLQFRSLKGRPAIVVDDFGLHCGSSGKDPCATIYYWDGERFSRDE